ncbi:Hypothetical predicted protein, partial [Paramuricea clavata]
MKPKSITEDQSYTKSTIGSDNREKEVDVVNVLGTKWDSPETSTRELTSAEVSAAESLWVKSVQSMSFAKEIEFLKTPLVHQFGLFLDGQEILRCKGRINEATLSLTAKIPALLPPKHWFTEL